jgi:hypothetical protein
VSFLPVQRIRTSVFDTTNRWAVWSTGNFTAGLLLHITLSGWVGARFFFYDAYNVGSYGPYISNVFHFWAIYIFVSLLMNFNLPRHPDEEVKALWSANIMWAVTILWEFAELLYFNVHMGFEVDSVDTLLNLITGWVGAQVAVWHSERSIP